MRFDKFYEPTSISECAALLRTYGSDACLLAGGTDIVPKLRSRVLNVKTVISLGRISDLTDIKRADNGVKIGSMVTLRKVSRCDELNSWLVVKEAAGHVSSMQVRNVATLGGNSCNASPSADSVQGLLVVDAVADISGGSGSRKVPLIDFFVGPGKTVLKEDEVLTGFSIPAPSKHTGAVYKKYAIRGDTDIAIVGVSARLTLANDGKISEARISLAAVAPKPIRATETEQLLVGNVLTEELIFEAAELAGNRCSPISDQRATKEYRLEMVKVWVRHALVEAQERAERT